jgi:hypothetical protein
MKLQIYLTIGISTILAFALILDLEIPMTFQNVFAQGEDLSGTTTDGNSKTTGGMTNGNNATGGGMSEGKIDPNGEAPDLGTGGP